MQASSSLLPRIRIWPFPVLDEAKMKEAVSMYRNKIWFTFRQLNPEIAEYCQLHISFINSQKRAQPESTITHSYREQII